MTERSGWLLGLCFILGGCGTAVPDVQEFPGDTGDGMLLVNGIVLSVKCELRDAIYDVISSDKETATRFRQRRMTTEFQTWGVLAALRLTMEEKSAVGASFTWMPAVTYVNTFTLGGGAGVSSTATRTSTITFYYGIDELYRMGRCSAQERPTSQTVPLGSLLIQSDLKVRDWLSAHLLVAGMGTIPIPSNANTPVKQNALFHEVQFEVLSSGTLTPSWTLVEASINSGGPFLSLSRKRVHDLQLTFGPSAEAAAPAGKAGGSTAVRLSAPAEALFLAGQIGAAVRRDGF